MKWTRYTIQTRTIAEDLISMMLAELGVEGVEIEDNIPLREEDMAKMFVDIAPELPPDDGSARLHFYLDPKEDHTELLDQVRKRLDEMRPYVDIGEASITKDETEDADWLNNWKEFFHSFSIGSLRICPTWEETDVSEGDTLIRIDPGISFGTGKHETTQLCIRQLQKHLQTGDKVLDLGCGSGILSIVAMKLGAGHVTGTDLDPDCMLSVQDNFMINELENETEDFFVGNLIDDAAVQQRLQTGDYDIVVANILADVIIPMAKFIPDCLREDGLFIASGILHSKEASVCRAIYQAGLSIEEITHQGEWVEITARK